MIGTSVAYHLTKLGLTDVVLLEQGQLSSGTTWHAAGLVGQLRASESATRLVQYSTQLYAELEDETGLSAGLQAVRGSDRRPHRGPDDPAAPHRRKRRGVQHGVRTAQPRAGARALPRHEGRRPGRRHLATRRRQGQPDRPDVRAGQGGADARHPRRRKDQSHRHSHPRRAGHRCAHRRGRHRGRDRRQLRRAVGQTGRCDGRRQRAPAFGRALLRGDRGHRRCAPRPADPARPRRLHLLQGRGRRPRHRRIRAGSQAVGVARRHPVSVRIPTAGRGLGPLRDPDEQRLAADPRARGDRHQEVLQRPGELHPRQPVHPRRGPRTRQLLRRRRIQLGGHRHRGRCGPGACGVDRQRRTHQRPHRRRHPPVRAVQRQQPLAARPGRRGARPALRNPLAQPGDEDRPAVPSVAGASPAGGRQRQLRQQDGLGARQLLRPRRCRPGDRVHLGQAELAAVVGGRTDQHPHRRHRVRPDVVLQVRDGRARTRSRRCSGCAPRTSASRSARRSTPGCSTNAAPTNPTSP